MGDYKCDFLKQGITYQNTIKLGKVDCSIGKSTYNVSENSHNIIDDNVTSI